MNGWREYGGEQELQQEALLTELEKLLAFLIEKGVSGNISPQTIAQLKQSIRIIGKELGVWEEGVGLRPDIINKLVEASTQNKQVVISFESLPGVETIKEGLEQVRRKYPTIPWSELKGRGGLSLPEYLRNIAAVMTNKTVYECVFDEDPIELMGEDELPENGRHRWLVSKVMEELGYRWNNFSWERKEK